MVCRTGFEPVNRNGAVLQTAALPGELQKHGDRNGARTHNLKREGLAT